MELISVNYKKSNLKQRAFRIVKNVLKNLKIGEQQVKICGESKNNFDVQRMLLNDIKDKLLGKTVKAKGSIVQTNDRLYLFPRTVSGVS